MGAGIITGTYGTGMDETGRGVRESREYKGTESIMDTSNKTRK